MLFFNNTIANDFFEFDYFEEKYYSPAGKMVWICEAHARMAPAAPPGKPRRTFFAGTRACRQDCIPVDRNRQECIRGGRSAFLSILSTGMYSCAFLSTICIAVHSCRQECIPVDRNVFLTTEMYSCPFLSSMPVPLRANNTKACRGAPPAPWTCQRAHLPRSCACTHTG